nr:unnamed protein product [Callosobruchus analis]
MQNIYELDQSVIVETHVKFFGRFSVVSRPPTAIFSMYDERRRNSSRICDIDFSVKRASGAFKTARKSSKTLENQRLGWMSKRSSAMGDNRCFSGGGEYS